MLVSLGAQEYIVPTAVTLVGTYDENEQPNIMPCLSAAMVSKHPPRMTVAIRPTSWTYRALIRRQAFTLSLPGRNLVAQVDYTGLISGEKENKFSVLGLTPAAGEHVHAPYVAECPVVIELSVIRHMDLGSHTLFISEVLDTKIEEKAIRPDRLPDAKKIDPLCYSYLASEYYSLGDFVARGYAVGKTVSRLNLK